MTRNENGMRDSRINAGSMTTIDEAGKEKML